MTRYQSFSFILLLACSCVSVQVLPCGAVKVLQPGAHQEPRQPQVEEESSAAESYMRELYQQTADENGIPKSGSKFSSVRCFTGTGEHLSLYYVTCAFFVFVSFFIKQCMLFLYS